MTAEEYIDLVKKTHELISQEIDNAENSEFLDQKYPKLITMYEFFRLLRGEAFTDIRPSAAEEQKNFYKMEHEILERLENIKKKLNFDDEHVKFYIQEAQKAYSK